MNERGGTFVTCLYVWESVYTCVRMCVGFYASNICIKMWVFAPVDRDLGNAPICRLR